MITPYVITEVITEHCQRSMATFDSEPHVSMFEHPVCSLAARRLSDMAQNPGGHNLGLCCQAGEIPSLNFPSTLSSVINPGGCPTFFNLQFH